MLQALSRSDTGGNWVLCLQVHTCMPITLLAWPFQHRRQN